jgi:hypothetical protein
MQFEWGSEKKESNQRKHGVSFEEAETVFGDPLALIFDDEWHSGDEDRELIIGQSANGRLLIVSFTERNGMIRLISARETTSKERKDYEENAYYKR